MKHVSVICFPCVLFESFRFVFLMPRFADQVTKRNESSEKGDGHFKNFHRFECSKSHVFNVVFASCNIFFCLQVLITL